MDTFILNVITQELREQICPARINRIGQPDDFSISLVLWHQGQEHTLAISVDTRHQYIFLSSDMPDKQVSIFGKFLQHHIKGGEIRNLRKPCLERILTFEIVKRDIDGQELTYLLILELMGRYSNLILVNQATDKILDSIRHVTAAQSSYRRIAPGALYVPPPPQTKTNPLDMNREQFDQLLQSYQTISKKTPLWKFLIRHLQGVSPLIAKDIAGNDEEEVDPERVWRRFTHIVAIVRSGEYTPVFLTQPDTLGERQICGLSAISLHNCDCRAAESMNRAAAHFYTTVRVRQAYEHLQVLLLRPLSARLAKLRKKRQHLLAQQEQIEHAEQYKQKGDLITANIYQLHKGMRVAEVIDYYSPNQSRIEIELDARLTPAQNAQRYFKKYNKLKHGKGVTLERLQATEQEIASLEERTFFIEEAENLERLETLQAEWAEQEPDRPCKPNAIKKSGHSGHARPFLRAVSSDGFDIYVGRSSKENDLLTQRTAVAEDIWLHAHQTPGSHVLILNRSRNTIVPERTLREAAALAAYHSKLRNSGKVDVIYTPRKYVKKPKGSPAGLVTLTQFQTIRVTPRKTISSNNN